MRFRFALLFLLSSSSFAFARPLVVQLPNDPSVIDARRDFGARGDGKTDDTDALQKAIDASCGIGGKTRALFLPDGTYRVTKSLVVNNAIGPFFYGQSRDRTIIKLDDGVKDVTAVLRTHPHESGPTSADWFMRNLRNFSIDVGNNPGTDGIRYFATNTGTLQNVRVFGHGKIGVNAGFLGQSGPNLVQDVEIEGFETGVFTSFIWGETLSRITIKNCSKVGVVVTGTAVGIEDLRVEDTPLALRVERPNDWTWWSGVVALAGATFTGGNPSGPAIQNDGVLYARDVFTRGFGSAIGSSSPGGNVAAQGIGEYLSSPPRALWDAPAKRSPLALNLPVKREPSVPFDAPDQWVCANDFGAVAGDNKDDTKAIQDAIDFAAKNGKTTVFLRGIGGGDPNWYQVDGQVRVHGSVRFILGLGWARILGVKDGLNAQGGRFIVGDDCAPVVKFQNIDSFGAPPVILENHSQKTAMVVESCGVSILGTGRGDIFATDCPAKIALRSPGQKMWARQLNPEGDSDTGLVENAGGVLWDLGLKCEGRGVRIKTTRGGQTEVLGAFLYSPDIAKDDARPLFENDGGALSLLGIREISFGNTFNTKIKETRGGQTRTWGTGKEGGWIGWALYDGRP